MPHMDWRLKIFFQLFTFVPYIEDCSDVVRNPMVFPDYIGRNLDKRIKDLRLVRTTTIPLVSGIAFLSLWVTLEYFFGLRSMP